MQQSLNQTPLTQIALVVDNIEKYAAAWAKVFNVPQPKWFLTDGKDKAHTKYEGKDSDARAKLAFIQAKNITIELIEPVGGDSVWAEFLKKHGPGVHHIAASTDDMKKTVAQLGLPVSQTGDYTGGCYAYLRGEEVLGVDIELLKNDSK
jgi:4-hydroxyphenylpyruvate dioxygenase-like putative hemolysin